MQEEETVPDGEKQQEESRNIDGLPKRSIIRGQAKLVRLLADSKLPKKLPDNLIYWNRCECRIDSKKLVTHSMVLNF